MGRPSQSLSQSMDRQPTLDMSAEQVVVMASKQWKRSDRHPQRRLRLIDREASVTHLACSLRYLLRLAILERLAQLSYGPAAMDVGRLRDRRLAEPSIQYSKLRDSTQS